MFLEKKTTMLGKLACYKKDALFPPRVFWKLRFVFVRSMFVVCKKLNVAEL